MSFSDIKYQEKEALGRKSHLLLSSRDAKINLPSQCVYSKAIHGMDIQLIEMMGGIPASYFLYHLAGETYLVGPPYKKRRKNVFLSLSDSHSIWKKRNRNLWLRVTPYNYITRSDPFSTLPCKLWIWIRWSICSPPGNWNSCDSKYLTFLSQDAKPNFSDILKIQYGYYLIIYTLNHQCLFLLSQKSTDWVLIVPSIKHRVINQYWGIISM